jgi:hypothetical protein
MFLVCTTLNAWRVTDAILIDIATELLQLKRRKSFKHKALFTATILRFMLIAINLT